MGAVSALPEALLAVPELGISVSQAMAVANLGSMAQLAHCVDVQEVASCTGIPHDCVQGMLSFFERAGA
jgi:hypothetical protein